MTRSRLALLAVSCAALSFIAAGQAAATTVQIDPARNKVVIADGAGNAMPAVVQADTFPFLNMTTATTTKIVTGVALKKTYISTFHFYPAGATNGKLVSGSGSNCGTGTTDLTPTYNMTAGAGLVVGNGVGEVLVADTGLDVCAVSSAAVNLGVQLGETQF